MRGTLRALALAAVLAGAAGCGPKPGIAPRAQPVPVRVTNQNRADVVIYMVRSGTQARLGTVVSGETTTLTIRNVPLEQLQRVQFDVRRIGADGTFRTRQVSLGREQMVVLRIEDLLSTSQVSVAENPSPAKQLP
ncbi:MAG TPA: hypothetical protein VEX86_09855 [Longimicrobium sp.]|nr:hypothetical protein [Longimicrobium sp.]